MINSFNIKKLKPNSYPNVFLQQILYFNFHYYSSWALSAREVTVKKMLLCKENIYWNLLLWVFIFSCAICITNMLRISLHVLSFKSVKKKKNDSKPTTIWISYFPQTRKKLMTFFSFILVEGCLITLMFSRLSFFMELLLLITISISF